MNDVPDLSARTMLIVEDHPDSAFLMDTILAGSGLVLVFTRTTEQAKEVLRTTLPDILLCDLKLPGEDGLAFIRWVRAQGDPLRAGVPAVALTAFHERYTAPEVREAGFDELLHKPVDPEHLLRTIRSLVHRRQGTP